MVSFVAAPALTVTGELVLAVLVPSVMSLAVTVCPPAVLSVTLAVRAPAVNAPLAGSVALESLEVMPTVCVTVLTRFQFASTALTVTLNAVPVGWEVGVPVLPVTLPGAAVSPGTSTCSLTNAPTLTVMDGLVLEVLVVRRCGTHQNTVGVRAGQTRGTESDGNASGGILREIGVGDQAVDRCAVGCALQNAAAGIATGGHHSRVIARAQVPELVLNPNDRLLGKCRARGGGGRGL